MSDPAEQIEYWDRRLDTQAWRIAVDTLPEPHLLQSPLPMGIIPSTSKCTRFKASQVLRALRGAFHYMNNRLPDTDLEPVLP